LVIALNKIRAEGNYFRAAKRDMRLTVHAKQIQHHESTVGGKNDEDLAFLQLAVAEALDRLPPHCKPMVTLRIECYEVAEIAEKTGRSHRTVERILQQARQRLNELLQGE